MFTVAVRRGDALERGLFIVSVKTGGPLRQSGYDRPAPLAVAGGRLNLAEKTRCMEKFVLPLFEVAGQTSGYPEHVRLESHLGLLSRR